MKKLLALCVTLSMVFSTPAAFSAPAKIGSACQKVNEFQQSGSNLLVCSSSKGKKTWRKASALEKSLYLKDKNNSAKEAAQRILDLAKAEAARIILEAKAAASAGFKFPTVSGVVGVAPSITPPTGSAPTTLQTQDIIVGTGKAILPASILTVHYTLMTWSNGALVESSWSGGQPATFPLSSVIVGWQEGLLGAKVGGRRLLVIPPNKAYGTLGNGPIGPNETLIFVVDVIAVS